MIEEYTNCKICGKEYPTNSEHFELHEYYNRLLEAIQYIEGLIESRQNHVHEGVWKRSIKKYKKSLKDTDKKLKVIDKELSRD